MIGTLPLGTLPLGIEPWRYVWRQGLAPQLPLSGLIALRQAILADDEALIQGQTTMPPCFAETEHWRCEGACAIGYAWWRSDGPLVHDTVGLVDEAFAQVVGEADRLLGPLAFSHFAEWFDQQPRHEVLAQLLVEVEEEIARRAT